MADEKETETPAPGPPARTEMRPDAHRVKDSDRAIRPGFRNPANTRSKASKKGKKGKKRR